MSDSIPHDKPDQLEKVRNGLLTGERLLAVFDCIGVGTGFVGLTDKRLILQDNSFVGKKTAVTSIPIRSIAAVAFVSDKSMFGGFYSSATLGIRVGSEVKEATFRGDDKAKFIHDTILYLLFQ